MTRRSYHKRAAQKRWQRRAPGFLCGRSKMARERQKRWERLMTPRLNYWRDAMIIRMPFYGVITSAS